MNSGDIAPMVVMSIVAISAATVIILRGALGRALARRLEGGTLPDANLVHQLEDIENRLQSVEQVQARLEEIEERLDFAERLLARGGVPPQIEKSGR
jgi:hypothetical protein